MDERNLSFHEDLLSLFYRVLSEEAIEGIFAFQKRVTESFGFGGFSCVMWDNKVKLPKFVFDDLKLQMEENILDDINAALNHVKDAEPVHFSHNSADFLLLPISRNEILVGYYILILTLDKTFVPPKTFLESMNNIGVQIYSRFLNDGSAGLDWFFKLGIASYCLNSKQKVVLELLFKGETNKSIADKVNLCEQAVKYHVSCLLVKFQVKTRYELKEKIIKLSRGLKSALD